MAESQKPERPQCPIGLHNELSLSNKVEHCHTHKHKWRQGIHQKHCKRLKCPHADHPKYGKWGGYFDTRESKILG